MEGDLPQARCCTSHFTLPMSQRFGLYCSHFTGEETEAPGVSGTCPGSHNCKQKTWGWNAALSDLQAPSSMPQCLPKGWASLGISRHYPHRGGPPTNNPALTATLPSLLCFLHGQWGSVETGTVPHPR